MHILKKSAPHLIVVWRPNVKHENMPGVSHEKGRSAGGALVSWFEDKQESTGEPPALRIGQNSLDSKQVGN